MWYCIGNGIFVFHLANNLGDFSYFIGLFVSENLHKVLVKQIEKSEVNESTHIYHYPTTAEWEVIKTYNSVINSYKQDGVVGDRYQQISILVKLTHEQRVVNKLIATDYSFNPKVRFLL